MWSGIHVHLWEEQRDRTDGITPTASFAKKSIFPNVLVLYLLTLVHDSELVPSEYPVTMKRVAKSFL
jgi:hypothetical protein